MSGDLFLSAFDGSPGNSLEVKFIRCIRIGEAQERTSLVCVPVACAKLEVRK